MLDSLTGFRELAERHWGALTLDLHVEDRPLASRYVFALYAFHLVGLLAVVRLTHQPLWLGLIPVLLIQPLAISVRLKKVFLLLRRSMYLET